MNETNQSTDSVLISKADIEQLIERLWDSAPFLTTNILVGRTNADSSDDICVNMIADISETVIKSWAHRFFPEIEARPLIEAGRFNPEDDAQYGIDRLEDLNFCSQEDENLLKNRRTDSILTAFRSHEPLILFDSAVPLSRAFHQEPVSYTSDEEAQQLLNHADRNCFDLFAYNNSNHLKLQAVPHGENLSSQADESVLVGWLSLPKGREPDHQSLEDLEDQLTNVIQYGFDSLSDLIEKSMNQNKVRSKCRGCGR